MNQKNRELARRNTELLEEISRLTDIHSDILKGKIKEKYNRTRAYKGLVEQMDGQIETLREMLKGSLALKESLTKIMEEKGEESEKFKETMEILDSLSRTPLKEKSENVARGSGKRKRGK